MQAVLDDWMMTQPSLEFGDLPLQRVECVLALKEPREVAFDAMVKLRQTLQGCYPNVENVPASGPIGLVVLTGPPHFRVSNLEQGTYVDLSSVELTAGWTLMPTKPVYVRYPALREALGLALAVLEDAAFDLARISYHVQAQVAEGANPWEYITPAFLPPETEGQVPLYDIAFTYGLDSGTNYGLRISPVGAEYSIVTIGTRVIGEQGPLSTLDTLHGEMLNQFERLITEAAKKEWKHGHVGAK